MTNSVGQPNVSIEWEPFLHVRKAPDSKLVPDIGYQGGGDGQGM
jgi:hypothetical protein